MPRNGGTGLVGGGNDVAEAARRTLRGPRSRRRAAAALPDRADHLEGMACQNVNTVAELLSPGEDYPWEAFEGPPDDWALADMAFSRGG